MTNIKITALTDIGNNIAPTTLVPVVDMAGTPTTKKSNLQNAGNLILSGAGGSNFVPAARATLAQSVTNAAQPNITSTGTLTSLTVAGNVNLGAVSNITITGGSAGQVLSTDGNGVLSWANDANSTYSNSNVANYLPTFTGTVGANRISSNALSGSNVEIDANGAVFTFGQGGALFFPAPSGILWAIEPNIDNELEIKSTSNVVISTDISNANSHFTFDSDGIFTAPSNVNLLGSRLNVGPDAANAANLLNPTLVIANTGAQYIQAAIINNDAAGSSDWSADGAGGGDEEAWTDMGFAGFSFNDANFTVTAPGDGYLFVQGYANGLGGNMVLATGDHSNTADIIFATGGFLANAEFARIDHSANVFHLTRTGSGIKFQDGSIQTTAATGNIITVNLDGNVSNVLRGDGTFSADANSSYGDSNVVSLLGSFGSNTITTTGNVSVGNISGNGAGLSSLTGANVTGNVSAALLAYAVDGANVSGNVSAALVAYSVDLANVSGAGNIASVNLDGNVSNVLTGNGTFTALPVIDANTVIWTTAPTANTDPGTEGQAAYDAGGNLYVCVSTNTWSKISGTTSW